MNVQSTKDDEIVMVNMWYCIKRERRSGERRAAYEWRYGYAGATVSSSCQISSSAVMSQERTNSGGGEGGGVEEVEERMVRVVRRSGRWRPLDEIVIL